MQYFMLYKINYRLDGDEGNPIISSDGHECERDIVQFVPFSKYKDNFEALARETLAEIPKQFLDYMTAHEIEPNIIQEDNVLKNHEIIKNKLEKLIKDRKEEKKIPSFLRYRREEFTKKLIKLEIQPELIQEVLDEGIPAPDVGLFIEMASLKKMKPTVPTTKTITNMEDSFDEDQKEAAEEEEKKGKMIIRQITIGKERNIEAEKSKAKEESYKITQALLEARDKEIMQRKSIVLFLLFVKEYLVEALGIEFVKKNNDVPPPKGNAKIKKRRVFEEYQDHNEHFNMLTRDVTPVSVEDNICMKCRENLINTVNIFLLDFLYYN